MPSLHRVLTRARRRSLRLLFPALASSLLLPVVFAASANAAPPTPESATICGGSLTKDPSATPTSDDPNLIDYKFHCDGDITAYTLIANRRLWDFETMDDFSTTASVNDAADQNIVSNQSFGCEGTLPGNGINCNAGAGGLMSAWNNVHGTFDLTDPYCKNIPAGAKPGTYAEPQAMVQLIVTDTTGAEDGPFRINLSSPCPAVLNRVPPAPKKHPRAKKHKAHGRKKSGHK
jgi:hypothetical protein